METNINNMYRVNPSVRPSFPEMFDSVRKAVRLEDFEQFITVKGERRSIGIKPLAIDICKIMTEVFMMQDCSVLEIGGEQKTVLEVKWIFCCLKFEHVENTIENWENLTFKVKNKKKYLRTMLYNSFFELEAGQVNEPGCF